jgi:nicotinate-nucleotide adenylyltransferase
MGQPRIDGQRVAFFGGSFDPPHLGHLAIARAAQQALSLDTVLFAPVGAQPLKPEGATASFADRVAMTRLAIAGEPAFSVSTIDGPIASSHPNDHPNDHPNYTPNDTPNYTFDTLTRLHRELGPQSELFFLMGADSFFSLRRWHRAEEIPFAATLIVASRPGEPLDNLKAGLPNGLTMAGLTISGLTISGLTISGPTISGLDIAPAHRRAGSADASQSVEVAAFLLRNPTGATAALYLLPGLYVEISASAIRQDVLALINTPQAATGDANQGVRACLPASVLQYIRTHQLYS